MVLISLFEVPNFLLKSDFYCGMYENIKELGVGSDEWVDEMRSKFDVPYFAEDDDVFNVEEFMNLVNVCQYWGVRICPSIFIYSLFNPSGFQLGLLKMYLKMYGYTVESFLKKCETFKNHEELDDSQGINIFMKHVIYEMPDFNFYEDILSLLSIFNENLEDIEEIELKTENSGTIFILKLFDKLYKFYREYHSFRDVIKDLPLIPYNETSEILNPNFFEMFDVKLITRFHENNYYRGRICILQYKFLNSNFKSVLYIDIELLLKIEEKIKNNITFHYDYETIEYTTSKNVKIIYDNNSLKMGDIVLKSKRQINLLIYEITINKSDFLAYYNKIYPNIEYISSIDDNQFKKINH